LNCGSRREQQRLHRHQSEEKSDISVATVQYIVGVHDNIVNNDTRFYFSLRRFAFFLLYLTASNSVLCFSVASYISGGSTKGQYRCIMYSGGTFLRFIDLKMLPILSFPHIWHRVRLIPIAASCCVAKSLSLLLPGSEI
jgi:hypothetical protein